MTNEQQKLWRTARACAQGSCVEVLFAEDAVFVRDRAGQVLRTSSDAWAEFSTDLKIGVVSEA